jgi:hypothetical protein
MTTQLLGTRDKLKETDEEEMEICPYQSLEHVAINKTSGSGERTAVEQWAQL